MEKIGVIGSAIVGQALAQGFKRHGYEVRIGSRTREKLSAFSASSGMAAILERFGWEPADMGTAVAARAIEPLCQLWCIPGFRQNQWTHAFAVFWK